jgi:DNA-directed RNA polymerase subunit alpha
MGYVTIESREVKVGEIGYMEMDSIFSPVMKAGIEIENVRVGKMTNWDRLVIDIKTDGTISPEKAFNDSVKILIEQFSALNKESIIKKDDEEIAEEAADSEDENNDDEEVKTESKKRGRPKKSE